MIYKFKSSVAGDVIMLGAHGDVVLDLIGRSPSARGIIEPEAMPAAIAALQAAVARDESSRRDAGRDDAKDDQADDTGASGAISLRRRVWPMIDLLERSLVDKVPVTWGV